MPKTAGLSKAIAKTPKGTKSPQTKSTGKKVLSTAKAINKKRK